MGIDPVTHKPKNDALHSASDGGQHSKNAANLSHMAQWESARLEAEARLVRQSKLRLSNNSNNTSSFNNCDPHSELHLNDHHYITMSGSTGTGTSPTPRCLDVFKAWQRGWTSTSTTSTDANNDDIIGISMGSTTGIGGGVGVGIESPTSTLSFSENAPPPVPVVPNMGNGAVIEFMGHHQNHDQDHHHMHNQEMGIKKEGDHHHIQHNNEHEWMSSLSFMPSHHINEQRSHDHDHDHDHQDDHDKNHDEAFIDGFTELLLSTNSTTTISDHQIATKTSVIGDNNNNNDNNNNDNNSSGTTTTTNSSKGSGSDYYEDNKTYWNSILNLVNSSPSHSPMF